MVGTSWEAPALKEGSCKSGSRDPTSRGRSSSDGPVQHYLSDAWGSTTGTGPICLGISLKDVVSGLVEHDQARDLRPCIKPTPSPETPLRHRKLLWNHTFIDSKMNNVLSYSDIPHERSNTTVTAAASLATTLTNSVHPSRFGDLSTSLFVGRCNRLFLVDGVRISRRSTSA